jgi:hypothetical protein
MWPRRAMSFTAQAFAAFFEFSRGLERAVFLFLGRNLGKDFKVFYVFSFFGKKQND